MGEAVSAVILAGGRATRLGGVNKAQLEIGGKRIIDRVVDSLRPLADQILVVGHLSDGLNLLDVEVLTDENPGAGTLAALHTGLSRAKRDVCLVVGCDMPFLSTRLLEVIVSLCHDSDIAVPRIGPHLEALHAAYRRTCLPAIEDALARRELKIINFYGRMRTRELPESEVRAVDPELLSFLNVNTPEDVERARSIVDRLEMTH